MAIMSITRLLEISAVGAAVQGPAGVQVSRPARVASHVHRPAQGQQELQEVGLDAGRRLHISQNLKCTKYLVSTSTRFHDAYISFKSNEKGSRKSYFNFVFSWLNVLNESRIGYKCQPNIML